MIRGVMPTIYVSDLDRAVKFYHDTLGLSLVLHVPGHWASVRAADGTNIGLHPAGPQSPRPGSGESMQLGLSPNEPIERAFAELERRGVRFRGPVRDDGFVKLAHFADPDGNVPYLCETKVGPGGGTG